VESELEERDIEDERIIKKRRQPFREKIVFTWTWVVAVGTKRSIQKVI